ncbi:transcriptional regulator [uncultured Rummeliibacillus sp.]|uniref:transcriptional regulator n=1 Tax=uncultured Rummeliibacillus sp. TaxID=762292 RepID=UPI0026139596|nr:transcriptional regulator [uncultured Rummeliibacillus sp.]
MLKEKLQKALERQQLVIIIYMSKLGKITKRRLRILEIRDDKFRAYCYKKHAQRTFLIDQILAIEPVIKKENEII